MFILRAADSGQVQSTGSVVSFLASVSYAHRTGIKVFEKIKTDMFTTVPLDSMDRSISTQGT